MSGSAAAVGALPTWTRMIEPFAALAVMRSCRNCGVLIAPTEFEQVEGPEDRCVAEPGHQGAGAGVAGAVGEPEPRFGVGAGQVADDALGAADLLDDRRVGELPEVGMVPGMVGQLVAGGIDALDQRRVLLRPLASKEEGRAHAGGAQRVEHRRRRGGAGAGVEGDRHGRSVRIAAHNLTPRPRWRGLGGRPLGGRRRGDRRRRGGWCGGRRRRLRDGRRLRRSARRRRRGNGRRGFGRRRRDRDGRRGARRRRRRRRRRGAGRRGGRARRGRRRRLRRRGRRGRRRHGRRRRNRRRWGRRQWRAAASHDRQAGDDEAENTAAMH